MVEFRLLGPVEVWAAGRRVDVGPPRQRTVFAALAADAGNTVSADVLVDRVWGDNPPAGARRSLHAHITRIRRVLDHAGAVEGETVPLVHRSGGYLLDGDRERVDLYRIRDLLQRSRRVACAVDERVRLLRQAVSQWRGAPLTGIAGPWCDRMRRSWRQDHLDLMVAWAHAELTVGNPGVVITRLSELVGEEPRAEPLAAALIRALRAAGRPAEAVEQYGTVRRRLAEELGVDPSAELQSLHRSILQGNPAAEQPAVIPAQLPADVAGFAGRAAHLRHLDGLLTDAARVGPLICAVSGSAGVGKTALAVHWAYRVADRFTDGQLYVNLRGFDPGGQPMQTGEALRGFLDVLGVPPERVPAALDAQIGLYRSVLAGKRVFIVFDNARDAEQVRPLLPVDATAVAVVTSRNQLTPLLATNGAQPLILDVLSAAEAHELLTRRLGADRVRAEPDATEAIIAACARLPLALAIAAARADHSGFTLAAFAAEIADGGPLDALDAGDALTEVRAVFSWSYGALTPEAARLFRLLGLHPGPTVALPAAASIDGRPAPATRQSLSELVRANLLVEQTPGRYAFHDLLRAYAADLGGRLDDATERRAALLRLTDHYLHTAYAADRQLSVARDEILIPLGPAQPDSRPVTLPDQPAAVAWLTTEQPVLLAVLGRAAAEDGLEEHAWQLAWALHTHLVRRGEWSGAEAAWRAAISAAARLGDLPAQGLAHRLLAYALTLLGRHEEALDDLAVARSAFLRAGDQLGLGHTEYNISLLWSRRENAELALVHAERALELYLLAGDGNGQAYALNSAGWQHGQLGDHGRGLQCCERALKLFQKTGDATGEASTWDSLGHLHHQLGDPARAVECYEQALVLFLTVGDRYNEADVLTHLGAARRAVGQTAAARHAWTRALDVLKALNHPDAADVRKKLEDLDATA